MSNRAPSVAFSDLEQSGAIKLGPVGNRKPGKEGNQKDGAKIEFKRFGFGYKLWSLYEYQRTCRGRQQQLALFYSTGALTCRSFSRAVRTTTGGFYCFWIPEVRTSVIFKPGNSFCYFATGGNFLMSTSPPLAWWTSSVWKNQTLSFLWVFSLSQCQHWNIFFSHHRVCFDVVVDDCFHFWCFLLWLLSQLSWKRKAWPSGSGNNQHLRGMAGLHIIPGLVKINRAIILRK